MRGFARDRPGHRDGQRGGFQETRPDLAIPLLFEVKVQRERSTAVAVQGKRGQGIQPVKETNGQRHERVAGQVQPDQGAKPGEEVPGQGF